MKRGLKNVDTSKSDFQRSISPHPSQKRGCLHNPDKYGFYRLAALCLLSMASIKIKPSSHPTVKSYLLYQTISVIYGHVTPPVIWARLRSFLCSFQFRFASSPHFLYPVFVFPPTAHPEIGIDTLLNSPPRLIPSSSFFLVKPKTKWLCLRVNLLICCGVSKSIPHLCIVDASTS